LLRRSDAISVMEGGPAATVLTAVTVLQQGAGAEDVVDQLTEACGTPGCHAGSRAAAAPG
jgi:hypothetical protein